MQFKKSRRDEIFIAAKSNKKLESRRGEILQLIIQLTFLRGLSMLIPKSRGFSPITAAEKM